MNPREALNLLSDGGLRQQQLFCGPAEIQVMGNAPEHAHSKVLDHLRKPQSLS
jgi:hypothetical protein